MKEVKAWAIVNVANSKPDTATPHSCALTIYETKKDAKYLLDLLYEPGYWRIVRVTIRESK